MSCGPYIEFSSNDFWVTLARGSHPFPSRTRQLSPSAPMVLHARVCGRVGRCPINDKKPGSKPGFFAFVEGAVRWNPRHGRLCGCDASECDCAAIRCGRLPGRDSCGRGEQQRGAGVGAVGSKQKAARFWRAASRAEWGGVPRCRSRARTRRDEAAGEQLRLHSCVCS